MSEKKRERKGGRGVGRGSKGLKKERTPVSFFSQKNDWDMSLAVLDLKKRLQHQLAIAIKAEHARLLAGFSSSTQEVDSKLKGTAIYENVLQQLDQFKEPVTGRVLKREVLQSRIIACILNTCLPCIYREDFHLRHQTILKTHRLSKVTTKLQIFAPRRMGKTFCVCWVMAALMLCVPRIKIAVFGKTLFTAEEILKTTYGILVSSDNYKYFKEEHKNAHQVVLTRGDERKELRAYCSTSDVSPPPPPFPSLTTSFQKNNTYSYTRNWSLLVRVCLFFLSFFIKKYKDFGNLKKE